MRFLHASGFAMLHNDRSLRGLVISALLGAVAGGVHAADPTPLSAAVIRGSSVYTPAQLFASYRAELGKPIDRTTARAVIVALEALYESDGYARPEIHADGALLESGILRIDVTEPRLSE